MTDVADRKRLGVHIEGAVQGVGFRPFVYRLAREMELPGWVINSADGVRLEVEGAGEELERFLLRLTDEKPAHATISAVHTRWEDPEGFHEFTIRHSEGGSKTAHILPDLAICPDCLRELRDPSDRRYRYPFINCTHCGPRYSIVRALPYDRPNTTMAGFPMCPDCQGEYEDPLDRRFHAQPVACPACGPQIALWDDGGAVLAERDEALLAAAQAVREGRILALKGLGGFQFIVDARSEEAVERLRRRKRREAKPFALMVRDLEAARELCHANTAEAELLAAAAAPIVLMRRRGGTNLAAAIAPDGNPELGVMLPVTPLHVLLMDELGFPVVATSGNRTDEPICTDEGEALERLGGIADLYLVHDRPIARHVDDSVARIVADEPQVLRRARGYAPAPLPVATDTPMVAVGAHLKNSVAFSTGGSVFLSQHIGDLETPAAHAAFREVIDHFAQLYDTPPKVWVRDEHPDYLSSRYADERGQKVIRVQHHLAHVYGCMAEAGVEDEEAVLGIAWDGTGYGIDRTVWGGEAFTVQGPWWRWYASLRPFPLPGGEAAVREPRRTAVGLLHEMLGDELWNRSDLAPLRALDGQERPLVRSMLEKGLNTPRARSMGRLFDTVASLLDLNQRMAYEGQAAMMLEWAASGHDGGDTYEAPWRDGGGEGPSLLLDWEPLIRGILDDLETERPRGEIAAAFHRTMAAAVVTLAERAERERVLLTGGCFQNRTLSELAIAGLRRSGFTPGWHRHAPPNDGGVALGQIIAAHYWINQER